MHNFASDLTPEPVLKTIIIDDEPKARKAIANIIEKYFPDIIIAETADNVKSGIAALKSHKPEIVFLDIQLGNSTGFDLLKEFGAINFKVIFITAYEKYAIKAFRFSAIDYILKPINPDDLIEAIKKTEAILNTENMNIKLNILLANREKETKKIVLRTSDSLKVANIQDIVRCEADGNYTRIYFNHGNKILVSRSLREFDEMLTEYGFFRVHNAHLINMAYLERCEKTKGGNVYMKDRAEIPVAFARKQSLIKALEQL